MGWLLECHFIPSMTRLNNVIKRLAEPKPCQPFFRKQRGASLPRAFGPFGDGAHDDAACKGYGIAGDREALAVAVGPCGSDLRPEGGFSFTRDIVDAVGWFGVGGLGLLGHDRLLDVSAATIRGFV